MTEREIIVNTVCPFCVKKYNSLMKWGKTKTYRDGVDLTKLIFEKRTKDSVWDISPVAMGWSTNDTNRITGPILQREYKKFAKENGISIGHINYSGAHTPSGYEFIVYDVVKGTEIKY